MCPGMCVDRGVYGVVIDSSLSVVFRHAYGPSHRYVCRAVRSSVYGIECSPWVQGGSDLCAYVFVKVFVRARAHELACMRTCARSGTNARM